uniref:Uncharacterized protein n=1 Tax=Glossina austeni TaxID=7395 RepID=A0A1A9VEC0_GLOAU
MFSRDLNMKRIIAERMRNLKYGKITCILKYSLYSMTNTLYTCFYIILCLASHSTGNSSIFTWLCEVHVDLDRHFLCTPRNVLKSNHKIDRLGLSIWHEVGIALAVAFYI